MSQHNGARRREWLTAREAALMASAWCRIRKCPREMVVPAIESDVIEAGYSEAEAQAEAARVWREFWERPSGVEVES